MRQLPNGKWVRDLDKGEWTPATTKQDVMFIAACLIGTIVLCSLMWIAVQ